MRMLIDVHGPGFTKNTCCCTRWVWKDRNEARNMLGQDYDDQESQFGEVELSLAFARVRSPHPSTVQ